MGETAQEQSIMLYQGPAILPENAKSFGELFSVLFIKHYHWEIPLLLFLKAGTISSVWPGHPQPGCPVIQVSIWRDNHQGKHMSLT